MVSEQFYCITNLEEIFYFVTKRIPYLYGFWRFANAYKPDSGRKEGVCAKIGYYPQSEPCGG